MTPHSCLQLCCGSPCPHVTYVNQLVYAQLACTHVKVHVIGNFIDPIIRLLAFKSSRYISSFFKIRARGPKWTANSILKSLKSCKLAPSYMHCAVLAMPKFKVHYKGQVQYSGKRVHEPWGYSHHLLKVILCAPRECLSFLLHAVFTVMTAAHAQ